MEGLPESDYASMSKLILESDLNLHINREQNRAAQLHRYWTIIHEQGTELLTEIEKELNQ